jgi:hypothetical protein
MHDTKVCLKVTAFFFELEQKQKKQRYYMDAVIESEKC